MKYLLVLEDLAITLSIGLHDFEKVAPQRLLVSVALVVEMDVGAGDQAEAVYDYDGLRDHIKAMAATPHHHLQETIAREIAEYCQGQPQISGGLVRTAKPDVYADAKAVGCQLVWGDDVAMKLLATAPK